MFAIGLFYFISKLIVEIIENGLILVLTLMLCFDTVTNVCVRAFVDVCFVYKLVVEVG